MGAVDHGEDAPASRFRAQFLGWQDQATGRQNMAKEEQPSSFAERISDSVNDVAGRPHPQGQWYGAQRHPLALGSPFPAPVHRAILMIGEKDLARSRQPYR